MKIKFFQLVLILILFFSISYADNIILLNLKGQAVTFTDKDKSSFFIFYDQPLCGKCLDVLISTIDSLNYVIPTTYFYVNEDSSFLARKKTYIEIKDKFNPNDIFFANASVLNVNKRQFDTTSLFFHYKVVNTPCLLVLWKHQFIYFDYKDLFEQGYNEESVQQIILKKLN